MTKLRGLTWQHPRAIDSIYAASRAYAELHPSITLEWTARPLHESESSPLEELSRSVRHPLHRSSFRRRRSRIPQT